MGIAIFVAGAVAIQGRIGLALYGWQWEVGG